MYALQEVSIQLVSPASGDGNNEKVLTDRQIMCFHSISFPSEWGHVVPENQHDGC